MGIGSSDAFGNRRYPAVIDLTRAVSPPGRIQSVCSNDDCVNVLKSRADAFGLA